MSDFNREEEYLEHYGVKGMKWHKHLKAATEWWKYGDQNSAARGQLMRQAQVTRLQGNNISPNASARKRRQIAAQKREQAIAQAPSKKVGNAIRSAGNTLDSVRKKVTRASATEARKISRGAKKLGAEAEKRISAIEDKRRAEGKSTRDTIKWNAHYHASKLKRKAKRTADAAKNAAKSGANKIANSKVGKAAGKVGKAVGGRAKAIQKYFSKEERNYRAAKKELRKVNLTGDGPALSSKRGGVLKRTAKGIGRSVSSIGKNAARTAAGASKKLSKGASKALNRLTSGASKFGNNISSKASGARKSAAKTASKAKKGAASTFKNLASGASKLGKGMGSRASSIRKSAGSAASKARKSIASGASNARKSISSIKSRNKKNAAKPKERQIRKDGATNITSNPKKKSIASTFKNLTSGIGKKKKKTSSWSKTYSESKKASKKRKRSGKFPWSR